VGAGVTAPADLRQGNREAERLARVPLSRLVEPGDARVAALVGQLGAKPVVNLVRSGLHDRSWSDTVEQRLEQLDPAAALERAARGGIRFVMPGDRGWPRKLADLEACPALQERGGAPIGRWVKGDLDLSNGSAPPGARPADTSPTRAPPALQRG